MLEQLGEANSNLPADATDGKRSKQAKYPNVSVSVSDRIFAPFLSEDILILSP
jgi:hypothetical protein